MNILKAIFTFELKRRLRWIEIILILVVLFIFLYFVNEGNSRYNEVLENKDIFQQMETLKVKQFHNYTLYGYYGISIFFIPSPFNIYNADTGFDALLSNVNTGERLDILQHRKGKNYFNKSSGLINLKGIMLLFTIFFSLLYGCDATRNKEFLRFLATFSSSRILFFAVSMVRIILLIISVLVVIGISHLVLLFKNVNLFREPLFYIILLSILVIGFFYFLGCIIGSFKSKILIGILFGGVYFASIFLIPGIVDQHTRKNADDIESLYKFELKNLNLIMSVEKNALEKVGVYNDDGDIAPSEFIDIVKKALQEEFEIIYYRNDRMMRQMLEKIHESHLLSCFFPVLFYNTTLEELSSCGGLSFIDYYRYSKKMKKEFINFYVEKKFFSNSKKDKTGKAEKVESFVKKDENLFYATSQLPYGFRLGMGINLLYLVILTGIAYIRFNRVLEARSRQGSMEKVDINLAKGMETYIKSCDSRFIEYFCAALSGKAGKGQGKIRVNGSVVKKGAAASFVYICSPGAVPPEITVNSLLNLVAGSVKNSKEKIKNLKSQLGVGVLRKRFGSLPVNIQSRILLNAALMKESTIYLIHGLVDQCGREFTLEYEQAIKTLLENDRLVVYLSEAAYPNSHLNAQRFIVVTCENSKYESGEIQ